jgi:hypothetical protein
MREVGEVTMGIDTVRASLVSVDANARREEVTGVGVGLEADEVATEHAVEDLFAAGEAAEELGRREGAVKEEGDDGLLVGKELAEHLGDEEKVVVVDPDLQEKIEMRLSTRPRFAAVFLRSRRRKEQRTRSPGL